MARYIFHLQDYAAATSFSCVTSPQFAEYRVSRANNRHLPVCRREIMHESPCYFVEKACRSSSLNASFSRGKSIRQKYVTCVPMITSHAYRQRCCKTERYKSFSNPAILSRINVTRTTAARYHLILRVQSSFCNSRLERNRDRAIYFHSTKASAQSRG